VNTLKTSYWNSHKKSITLQWRNNGIDTTAKNGDNSKYILLLVNKKLAEKGRKHTYMFINTFKLTCFWINVIALQITILKISTVYRFSTYSDWEWWWWYIFIETFDKFCFRLNQITTGQKNKSPKCLPIDVNVFDDKVSTYRTTSAITFTSEIDGITNWKKWALHAAKITRLLFGSLAILNKENRHNFKRILSGKYNLNTNHWRIPHNWAAQWWKTYNRNKTAKKKQ